MALEQEKPGIEATTVEVKSLHMTELNGIPPAPSTPCPVVSSNIEEPSFTVEAPEESTGFHSLSAELRNRIYEIVVIRRCNCVWRNDEDGECNTVELDPAPGKCVSSPDWRKQPSLTRVSREIRSEALPIYYGRNSFVCSGGGGEPELAMTMYNLSHGMPIAETSWMLRYHDFLGVAGRWLQAIGPHNTKLIRCFKLTMMERRIPLTTIEVYQDQIPLMMEHYLERMSIRLPPSAAVQIAADHYDRPGYIRVQQITMPWVQGLGALRQGLSALNGK